jgi:hypothetical protein
VTVKPPPVAVAAPAWNDVYEKSSALMDDSEQDAVNVTLTLNWPEVLAACATQVVIAAPTIIAAKISLLILRTPFHAL